MACNNGHKDVVKLLLDHSDSIELDARNYRGNAFVLACNNGHKDVVKLFLDHSGPEIDLNARDNLGMTGLMHAVKEGHKNVVQLLLNNPHPRIDLNVKDHFSLLGLPSLRFKFLTMQKKMTQKQF